MKKLIALALALTLAASLCGCESGGTTAAETSAPAETEAVETAAAETAAAETAQSESTSDAGPLLLTALPSDLDPANLTDCTVAAAFTADSFDWMGGNFTAELYAPVYYDMVDVAQLKEGDAIETPDATVTVESLTEDSGDIIVNQGTETELCLRPEDGGIYEIITADDMPLMQDMGEAELILSEDVVLTCQTDPSADAETVSSDGIKEYLESLQDSGITFNEYDTTVVIENGEVTEINRIWTP